MSNPKHPAVVAVFSPLGGSGTSTIAATLALVLAGWRIATTLLDLNLHAPALSELLQVPDYPGMETFLRDPNHRPLRLPPDGYLTLIPGLAELENLDDVSVGRVVQFLERPQSTIQVIDTAPVITDPAVYATLRTASHTVLVIEPRPDAALQLARYRKLFQTTGLGWDTALLVINHTRPTKTSDTAALAQAAGLSAVWEVPYEPGWPPTPDPAHSRSMPSSRSRPWGPESSTTSGRWRSPMAKRSTRSAGPTHRLYVVEVKCLRDLLYNPVYAIARTGTAAVSLVRPANALDHWEYRATEVIPLNGQIACYSADQRRFVTAV